MVISVFNNEDSIDEKNWFFSKITTDLINFKFSSNYWKHGNYVVWSNEKVWKVYQNSDIYDNTVKRLNFINSYESQNFTCPRLLDNYQIENKYIIELSYQETLNEQISYFDMIDFAKNVMDEIKNIPVTSTDDFQWYELKDEYENLFETGDMILSHGDINKSNIINSNHLVDWDNLSFKNENLEIGTTCFIYLCGIYNHDIQNWDNAVSKLKNLFGNDVMEKALIVGSKKALISVDNIHKNTFEIVSAHISNTL